MNLVSPQQLSAIAEASDTERTSKMYDEVAKLVLSNLMKEADCRELASHNSDVIEKIIKIHVKLAWDFAYEFMRERYERESVARAMAQPNFGAYPSSTVRPGDNPPDMDLINA